MSTGYIRAKLELKENEKELEEFRKPLLLVKESVIN